MRVGRRALGTVKHGAAQVAIAHAAIPFLAAQLQTEITRSRGLLSSQRPVSGTLTTKYLLFVGLLLPSFPPREHTRLCEWT